MSQAGSLGGSGSIVPPVTVPLGGTGVASLTLHGVLIGNGANPVNVTSAGTAGQFLISGGPSADPTWGPDPANLIGITNTLTPFTTALGYGASGSGTGVNNTAIGWSALDAATTAYDCTALGYNALTTNLASYGCTAVGSGALHTVNGTGTQGRYTTGIGYQAHYSLSTGSESTALGAFSLWSATTGNSNTAFGYAAAYTTNGSNNVALGNSALKLNTSGVGNTCLGYSTGSALTSNEGGNIFVGYNVVGVAGDSYITRIGSGISKCFVSGITGVTPDATAKVGIVDSNGQIGTLPAGTAGQVLISGGAGANPSWGADTTGIVTLNGDSGSATGATVTITSANNCGKTVGFTGSGSQIGMAFTDGNGNTFLGQNAGTSTLTGTSNNGVGSGCFLYLTSGSQNNAMGIGALSVTTTGNYNDVIGSDGFSSLTTGSYNVGLGDNIFSSIFSGNYNIGIGASSGSACGVGNESSNICIANLGTNAESNAIHIGTQGNGAGQQNTCYIAGIAGVTTNNTNYVTIDTVSGQLGAMTPPSMIALTATPYTTALGYLACATTTGTYNTGIGWSSLQSLTSGISNTCLGHYTGANYTSSESGNICIGFDVHGTTSENYVTRIGKLGTMSAVFIDGIDGKTVTGSAVLCDTNGQLGTISSSQRYKTNIEDIEDQSFDIYKLRPVSFHYKSEQSAHTHYGLIAEEVDKVYPELVLYDAEGLPSGVEYHELPALLLNEIKNLKKEIDDLRMLIS